MNTDIDLARDRVINQVLDADSLLEIEAAKQVLGEWMKAHPEEQGMRDGFEQLYTIQKIIEDEETRCAMSKENLPKSYGETSERQRIFTQALKARTLSEIAVATEQLHEWARHHPDDIGISEAFAGLSLMQHIAEEQEAEGTGARLEMVAAR